MVKIYTTEITSEEIASDNPIHQRLFKAYVIAADYMHGDVLEVGCGEGRGFEILMPRTKSFTAVDKIKPVIERLQKANPGARLISMNIPPLAGLADNSFDVVVSFQVIEHIAEDALFLQEIHRVLKPGGTALLTTPNRRMSLTRNPWHVREYIPQELAQRAERFFETVTIKGITGNEKVMQYYEANRKSVQRFTRWDIFDLQHKIPARVLRLPYEILNRWNRNKLQTAGSGLVKSITDKDYLVTDEADNALDLLLIARKLT